MKLLLETPETALANAVNMNGLYSLPDGMIEEEIEAWREVEVDAPIAALAGHFIGRLGDVRVENTTMNQIAGNGFESWAAMTLFNNSATVAMSKLVRGPLGELEASFAEATAGDTKQRLGIDRRVNMNDGMTSDRAYSVSVPLDTLEHGVVIDSDTETGLVLRGASWFVDEETGLYIAARTPATPTHVELYELREALGTNQDAALALLDPGNSVKLYPYLSLDQALN